MCLVYKAMNEVGKYKRISKAIKYDIFSKLEENILKDILSMVTVLYSKVAGNNRKQPKS